MGASQSKRAKKLNKHYLTHQLDQDSIISLANLEATSKSLAYHRHHQQQQQQQHQELTRQKQRLTRQLRQQQQQQQRQQHLRQRYCDVPPCCRSQQLSSTYYISGVGSEWLDSVDACNGNGGGGGGGGGMGLYGAQSFETLMAGSERDDDGSADWRKPSPLLPLKLQPMAPLPVQPPPSQAGSRLRHARPSRTRKVPANKGAASANVNGGRISAARSCGVVGHGARGLGGEGAAHYGGGGGGSGGGGGNNIADQSFLDGLTTTTTATATPTAASSSIARDFIDQMFNQPRYQQGLAYSYEQRKQHGLLGLLPPAIQDQDTQVRAVINFIDHCKDELGKYIYLRHLKDYNERLFYRALTRNVEKLMPIVYTPTVGLGCQKFSEIYMRPRGLFISINELGSVDSVLANWPERDVRVIVVTDGERILGLGDLGANGMGISIGKLSLYTALAGIPPQNVLPITLDVGTNNQQLLEDPFYIGLRQTRIRGDRYDSLIDEFMKAVVERWGRSCLIQFEDFGNSTAFGLLNRYREHYCTFNDDIQGTASVCLSGLLSAAKLIGKRLRDCTFLFYGAGEANLGTANLLVMAMVEEGAQLAEARKSVWLIDSKGLVVRARDDLSSHKRTYAQDWAHIRELGEIVEQVKPAAIIGASAQAGAFTESICKRMAQYNERPIIFALSNPTSKAECTADQAYRWTDGRCVFASGSPFEPVEFQNKTYITGQGNNAYIFPGVGLAAIAAHVHTIPEETFLVAARALSDQLITSDSAMGLIYPKLSKIREVTLNVAVRVLEYFYAERLATYRPEPDDKLNFLRGLQFDGSYDLL